MSEVEFLPQWYVRKRRTRARTTLILGAIVSACLLCLAAWAVMHRA
jgi:hypothetical protein